MKSMLDKKKSYAYFKFKKNLERDELPIADLLLNQMNQALTSKPGFENYNINGSWYQDEKDQYILGLFIYNYSDTEESAAVDPDSKEAKKIVKAVAEAFEVDEQPIETDSSDTEKILPDGKMYETEADVTAYVKEVL